MIRTTLRFAVGLSAFAMAFAGAPSAAQAQGCNVVVQSDDALRYLPQAIEVPRTCKDFTVTLTHSGRLPVLAMGHNWVLLAAGTDAMAFAMAAASARDTDYIPAAFKDKVIAYSAILGPRKSEEVSFKAPAPGEYVYLCSFPGHFAVGMKGKLIVK